jgi:hypothetical protein
LFLRSKPKSQIKLKSKKGISRSNAVTALVLVTFVGIVVVALVLTYVLPSIEPARTTTTSSGLYFAGLMLVSGASSSSSFNKTCLGDAYLELYVTNLSATPVNLTSVAISSSGIVNATSLIALSNGCLPISEVEPTVQVGANDYLVQTYPNVPVAPYTIWNVTIEFSDGQTLVQRGLVAQPT